MKNTILVLLIILLGLIISSCKEPSITQPTLPDENDFTYEPQPNITQPTVKLFINRSNKIIYVGEQFEIRVVLYNMPDSLFGAAMDLVFPSNIRVEKIIKNPNYIGSKDSTLWLPLILKQKISFAMAYKNGTTPQVAPNNTLMKLICRAVSVGNVKLEPSNLDYRIARKAKIKFDTQTPKISINKEQLNIAIKDEFGG